MFLGSYRIIDLLNYSQISISTMTNISQLNMSKFIWILSVSFIQLCHFPFPEQCKRAANSLSLMVQKQFSLPQPCQQKRQTSYYASYAKKWCQSHCQVNPKIQKTKRAYTAFLLAIWKGSMSLALWGWWCCGQLLLQRMQSVAWEI